MPAAGPVSQPCRAEHLAQRPQEASAARLTPGGVFSSAANFLIFCCFIFVSSKECEGGSKRRVG